MKRTLSLILAALILSSTITACGKTEPSPSVETDAVEKPNDTTVTETNAPAAENPATDVSVTDATETDPVETNSPTPSYDTSLITENGVAKAHIVIPENAEHLVKYGADELVYHIKLVSGSEISVTNAALEDSLPIIIATPDSLPELETLFPEDLTWLRTLSEEDGRRWGDDGFAIRQKDGKIYIFGATEVGSLNGVYDFIEENFNLLWLGSTEADIIFDEMPTINVVKADYREKSPFTINLHGWATYFQERNKQYLTDTLLGGDATVKSLLLASPTYDPNITEYWDTDRDGNPLSPSSSKNWTQKVPDHESKQLNFWSQLTADTVAGGVIATLDTFSDADRPPYINVCMEDTYPPSVYPAMTEPFEYAPGQFAYPEDSNYLSNVYFTFINRVARKVAEKYPDVYINTLAYTWATDAPDCEMEKNVSVWFCPYYEDYTQDSFAVSRAEMETESDPPLAALEAQYLHNWITKHPDTPIMIYNYYFCYHLLGYYERPIWSRLQSDLQYFAENGFLGTTLCGFPLENSTAPYPFQTHPTSPLAFTEDQGFDMSLLTRWVYYKLLWNPYEDLDALIVEFCDKVYGNASEHMQEYYALLKEGWDIGSETILTAFNAEYYYYTGVWYYYDYFLAIENDEGVYILDELGKILTKAYEAADDRAKGFIRYPYEMYQDWERILD